MIYETNGLNLFGFLKEYCIINYMCIITWQVTLIWPLSFVMSLSGMYQSSHIKLKINLDSLSTKTTKASNHHCSSDPWQIVISSNWAQRIIIIISFSFIGMTKIRNTVSWDTVYSGSRAPSLALMKIYYYEPHRAGSQTNQRSHFNACNLQRRAKVAAL
jgi:hypothetical protein